MKRLTFSFSTVFALHLMLKQLFIMIQVLLLMQQ